MRLGAFELNQPVPRLKEPHALVILKPWVDVGNVGTLTLSCLESHFNTQELAKLAKPGNFLDFTRYRPNIYLKDDSREVDIPNTIINYAKQKRGPDFLFLHLFEPHMLAEVYIDSILEILKRFKVKRYCLFGSMYDMVPHTRPLLVTGTASNPELQDELALARVTPSSYQGSTTILYLVGQQALKLGIETVSMVVHLPSYLMMADDYRGERRLMEAICTLYNFVMPQIEISKAKEQEEQVNLISEQIMQQDPRLRLVLKQLETNYDSRIKEDKEEIKLSPEVEKFLQELDKRFRQG